MTETRKIMLFDNRNIAWAEEDKNSFKAAKTTETRNTQNLVLNAASMTELLPTAANMNTILLEKAKMDRQRNKRRSTGLQSDSHDLIAKQIREKAGGSSEFLLNEDSEGAFDP